MKYMLSEIAAVCGGKFYGKDRTVTRVITDSRTFPVGEDTLFVAIRTPNRDGADFIGDLYARGVRGFLVGDDFPDAAEYPEAGFIAVKDTVSALQALAAHYRNGFKGKVVGITGSYGKTIVKEWIAQLTPPGVNLFRSPRSYNSQTGVPLSVLMATGKEDYVVIEAGISEPGEMARLERIIRPDIGILTTLGNAHVENFASTAELTDEKLKLFRSCPVVIREEAGNESAADVTDRTGDFAKHNAALALAFWRHEGYEIAEAAVENLQPVAMRLEVREGAHGSIIINDTYNSDINSLSIALDYLRRVAGERSRMVVMADMVVTGNNSEEDIYRRAARLVEASGVGHFVGIGPRITAHAEFFGAVRDASFHATADEFLRSTVSDPAALQDRTILIKGGARMGFERIGHALERKSHTTVMEVDLDAMIRNLRLCRSRLAPGVGLMAMIKASGYGHGTFEVARMLQQQGVDYLAVAFADEGVALREGGIRMPIVVLNADADSFEPMIRHRLEPEIYNFVSLEKFVSMLKRHGEQHYPIHIKLDTGMHRLGFRTDEIPQHVESLAGSSRFAKVGTIFSHLAAADDPAEDGFTRGQIALFGRMSGQIAATLPYPVKLHIANTKGLERFPEAHFDMVRLGIGLYGIGMEGARPVASLKTRIVNIAGLDAGETVGYNRRGVLNRPSKIATIPIGYADGLSRRLGRGAWSVLVGGNPAPIVGNVCMDSCMIDITDIPGVGVGDEVIIFSSIPGNTVEDMAQVFGTIPYEILTSVSTRVKRIYIKE